MALSTGSKVFMVFLLLAIGGAGGALWYANDQLQGEPGEGTPVEIEIPQGASAAQIGSILAEEGVVKNALAFRLVARTRNAVFIAGEYELETGMSVDEAIDTIVETGPRIPETIRFTVIEGQTVKQTLDQLATQFADYSVDDFRSVLDARIASGLNAEGTLQLPEWVPDLSKFPPEVREPFEGLLFPETYEILREATPQQVLQRMVNQLTSVVDAIPQERVQATQDAGLDRYQAVILASLIERETRVDEERPKVSSVIHNRLREGQLLQIDATVLYAMGEQKERVLSEDLEFPSPYNTYQNAGLPPTPISGVGRASIEAAFNPADTGDFYYVLSPECDGSHRFAPTLDEHNRNVQAFRDAGRCASS